MQFNFSGFSNGFYFGRRIILPVFKEDDVDLVNCNEDEHVLSSIDACKYWKCEKEALELF